MDDKFVAVVVGGGPAGASAAITLARLGQRVILIDDNSGRFKIGEALTPASRPLLRDLGVMDRFLGDGHLACYGNVSVWGSSDAHCTDFVSNPHGNGWHLDRARFDAMLQDEARIAGAEVVLQARFTSAENEHGGWSINIRTANGVRELHAGWLIDATGRSSFVARQMGAERNHDDRLVAFFVRCRPSGNVRQDVDARTFIEATPNGWWYTALLPSGERIVAFLTDSDIADQVALKRASGFMEFLATSPHVGELVNSYGYWPEGDPHGVDAGTARLDCFEGPGWLAVGDAALSFDPLSSQGMLNALYMGLKAGQAIAASFSGDHGVMGEYGQHLENIANAYRINWTAYYAAEQRWREQPFWQRRIVD